MILQCEAVSRYLEEEIASFALSSKKVGHRVALLLSPQALIIPLILLARLNEP